MGMFKVDWDNPNFVNDIMKKYKLTESQTHEVTQAGANVHMLNIRNQLHQHPLKYSKGGLDESIHTEPTGTTDNATSVSYTDAGFYYRFVDEGHYQLYYGHVVNNGNRYFPGYHFVEAGYQQALEPAALAMHQKLEQIWGRTH